MSPDNPTGKLQQKLILKSPPVFDGMIAADKSLIISLQNGKVIRAGAPQ